MVPLALALALAAALAAAMALVLFLAAPAGAAGGDGEEPQELQRLRGLRGGDAPAATGPPRDRAQREAALSTSVQAGAVWRYRRIVEERVMPNAKALDRLFDFSLLLIRRGDVFVLPPVAVRAGRAVRLEDGNLRARGQERSYRIVEKARMALGPPDWREYLLADLPGPQETHPSILPSGAAEARLWRERVDRGWRAGVEEAEALFKARSALLARDFSGMLLYLELRGERLVSAPEVSVKGRARTASDEELVYMLTDYGLESRGSFAAPNLDGQGRAGARKRGAAGQAAGQAPGVTSGQAPGVTSGQAAGQASGQSWNAIVPTIKWSWSAKSGIPERWASAYANMASRR
jgi:defect-in-organelle-trafficking protein DotC